MKLTGSRLLFICPSRYSLGELYNALRIAKILERELAIEATFITGYEYGDYARADTDRVLTIPPRSADNRKWLRSTIDEVDPKLIVLADHEILPLERSAIDNETIYTSGRSVVVFDSLQFGARGADISFAIAKVVGAERIHRWWPPNVTIPVVPNDVPLMTPIPIANPDSAANPLSIYPSVPARSQSTMEVREDLGIQPDERLVVAAQSRWASVAFAQLSRGRRVSERYETLRARRLIRSLNDTGRRIAVVDVTGESLNRLSGEQVRTLSVPRRPAAAFTDLIGAADLFMTDNLISGAMAQSALLGTPVLCLVNSIPRVGSEYDPIDVAMDIGYPGWGFPYVVNPFGWHEELQLAMNANSYLESVPQAEVFDRTDVSAAIDRQLGNPDTRPTTVLQNVLPTVPDPAQAFERVAASL